MIDCRTCLGGDRFPQVIAGVKAYRPGAPPKRVYAVPFEAMGARGLAAPRIEVTRLGALFVVVCGACLKAGEYIG